jgi:mRNA interferase YafQ
LKKQKPKPESAEPPPPLVLKHTAKFDRDVKLQEKRGMSLDKLHAIVESLRVQRPLHSKHRDHSLTGDLKDWRECHIEPDWLLIYMKKPRELILGRTGTHSDLF